MSVWSRVHRVTVQPAERDSDRDCAWVQWVSDGALAQARVEHIEGRPRLVTIEVRAEPGAVIPGSLRRLPTDAVLLDALMSSDEGRSVVTWLRLRSEDPSPVEVALSKELDRTSMAMPKRARRATNKELREEIEWMRNRLESGLSASELVADFQARFYRSSATAYRRLKDARELAEEQEARREQ